MSYTSPFRNLDMANLHVDQKTQAKNMVYHQIIGEDPVLLDFLQDKKLDDKRNFKPNPLYNDPSFLNFVSLHFATSYQSLLIQHLSDTNPEKLATVLNLKPRLFTKEDAVMTWLRVELFLEEWKDTVYHLTETIENHEDYDPEALSEAFASPKIQCLNLLPPQFSWFREAYAAALEALSTAFLKARQPQIAINIATNALLLKNGITEQPENISENSFVHTKPKVKPSPKVINSGIAATQQPNWNFARLFWYTILMVLLYLFVFVELRMTFFDGK
jgi:hypothetical protein